MNFANDGEIPGTSQNTVERGERGLLKDLIPVLVFNERTLEEDEEDGKVEETRSCCSLLSAV